MDTVSAQTVSLVRPRTIRVVNRREWSDLYASRLTLTDIAVLTVSVLASYLVVFGFTEDSITLTFRGTHQVSYLWIAVGLGLVWLSLLSVFGTRDYRVIGTGTVEYKRIFNATVGVLGLIGLFSLVFQAAFSRSFSLLVLTSGLAWLMVSRWLWRQWLAPRRRAGKYSARVVVVGSMTAVKKIVGDLQDKPEAGYHVVGVCVSTGEIGAELDGMGVPVLGRVDRLKEALAATDADTVLVTGGHNISPDQMRKLSWSLEPGRQHLVMVPSLTDIAGPRIHTRPVAGLPLIHVETPRYEGYLRFLKRAFDTGAAAFILLILSPLLLFVAATIRLSSPGGVFFSHERIGKNGKPFRMLKFRSMISDADAQLMGLLQEKGIADKPLFKLENDPRITPIGRFIRKYSIDELPQLINVLRGEMALVGPRPQVSKEVAMYDNAAARRLFVKPGMTGLWQVSGRSSLTWEQSVRLDLYYIENWSIMGDLVIMWRTVRAVIMPGKEAF